MLAEAGLTEQELCMVANLGVEDVEEAKKLVPTLERYSDDELLSLLKEVQSFNQFK